MDEEEGEVMVGQMPTVMVPRHINKRSLKNKSLSISFDEKNLRDYVTGFHKRKKKRRKEAQKQIEVKDRKKRIADRKKRKQDKEIALYGRVLSEDADPNEGENNEEEEETDLTESIKETRTYEDNSTRVTVTTSEISKEDEDLVPKLVNPNPYPNPNPKPVVKNPILAAKKKPLKKTFKSHKKSKKDSSGKKDKKLQKGKRNKGRKK